MKNSPLPDVMLGCWIWSSPKHIVQHQEHALFRRDFILDAAPSSTEIQIAAHCGFQLFVNGRFTACGPTPHPGGNLYVCKYDVSHLMQIGANSIALKASCDAKPSTARQPRTPGFWLQIVADNSPILWTDDKWLTFPLKAYLNSDLRTSPAETSVEILNFEDFPQNWLRLTQKHFAPEENQLPDAPGWQKVSCTWPLKADKTPLEVEPGNKTTYELAPQPQFIRRGTLSARNSVHTLDVTPVYQQKNIPGTYAAETFFYLKEDTHQTIYAFSASPFKLFINDRLAIQRQCPENKPRYDLRQCPPPEEARIDNTQSDCETVLQKGWNKLLVVKWCDEPHSPFTLIFADFLAGEVILRRTPEATAQNGWSVAGPIKTPIQLIPENFSIRALPKMQFHDPVEPCRDTAAVSLACHVDPDQINQASMKLPVPLAYQQTAIFDFGKTIYAVPEIKLTGQKGDILDLVAGEHLLDNEIIALENGSRRNVSTIIVDDCTKPISWLLKENKGFRYVMLVARQTRTVITIHNVTAFISTCDTKGRGEFECDDQTLNQVWKAGVATLDTTLQGRFLDSPTKDQTQCIPDTMIQAVSAYATHGAYEQATRALEAFARSQVETGDINALTPSSFFQTIPDFSLLWPVWLQKHIQHTGDKNFLQQLLPTLVGLLDYYDSIAIEHDGPLGDVAQYLGNPPFIDVDTIDSKGISTALNAIYSRALFSAAWLAELCENTELHDACQTRAAKVAATIRSLTWDPERNLFADAYDNATRSPFYSWQTNVLAIYGGLAQVNEIPLIWNQLFTEQPPYENFAQGDFNNPYFKYFVLDCAFANNYSEWGLKLIRHYWGKMIEEGATTFWELFDPDNPALKQRLCSHCQGYAVAPNAFLISEVAGLRPEYCGMERLIFSPDLENVKWCRTSLPTPQGTIQLYWELRVNDTLQITINSNYPVEIIPVLSPRFAEKAVFKVNAKVVILAEDESEENNGNQEEAN